MEWGRMTRRDFLKGLGLLALGAVASCRRAQVYAIEPEGCPEWMRAGEMTAFATCMPWPRGAYPLLAVCSGGVPIRLEPNPHAGQPGLPAHVQASITDLYAPAREAEPTFCGKPYPEAGIAGGIRAWADGLRKGRRIGFLFPEGYSPLRARQAEQLQQAGAGVRLYAYDPLAEYSDCPAPEPLNTARRLSLGEPRRFAHGFGSLEELTRDLAELEALFIFTPADTAELSPAFAEALRHTSAETYRFCLRRDRTAELCTYTVPATHFLEEWGAEADAHGHICLRQPVTLPLRPAVSEAEVLEALLHGSDLHPNTGDSPARRALRELQPDTDSILRRGLTDGAPRPELPCPRSTDRYFHPLFADGRNTHNPWLREAYDPQSGTAGAPVSERGLRPFAPESRADELPRQTSYPARDLPGPTLHPLPGPGPQWGLLIDLSRCCGCNACTIACRAENNIPTVGSEQQNANRDLQWLRLRRYGSTIVPTLCRQCANAPCEAACPVNATVRTPEGLNAMVYPRCMGTRYCAAACPYGARTFNFFDYSARAREQLPLPANPRVTVRPRGVMEKCTLCVQRINAAKTDGSTPTTACAQACPTGAIRLVDLTRIPPTPGITTAFDVPGTEPRVFYLAPEA
ncbi:MAG: 4Fe-4S dicluster domain-containing protein [Akkermansia muciniphila]|nr:4Fe-4S dicluster domain-containing protein [Akkermansia muciniphila]